MSWAILTEENGISTTSVLYCNTTDVAFGPVMYDTDRDEAVAFTEGLPVDPRLMTDSDLQRWWGLYQEDREK
jgi:hypothetical protein